MLAEIIKLPEPGIRALQRAAQVSNVHHNCPNSITGNRIVAVYSRVRWVVNVDDKVHIETISSGSNLLLINEVATMLREH